MLNEPQDFETQVQADAKQAMDGARGAISRASQRARQAAHDLKELALDLRHKAHDMADEGQVRARRYYDAFDGRVRAEPMKAAGVALGAGVLLGLLIRAAAPHGDQKRPAVHH